MRLRYTFAVVLLAGCTVVNVYMLWLLFSAVLRSIAEDLCLLGVGG